MLWRGGIGFPWQWTSGEQPPVPVIPGGQVLNIDVPEALILQNVALPTTESSEFVIPSKGVYLTWSVTLSSDQPILLDLDAALKLNYFSLWDQATGQGLRSLIGGVTRIKVIVQDNDNLVAITVRVVVKKARL